MRWTMMIGCGVIAMAVTGCRTATHKAELPRVDLAVEGSGNRGYLMGTPPPVSSQKATREMVQTDIEIPSFYRPTHGSKKILKDLAPPEVDMADQSGAVVSPQPGTYDTYTVKKNDSLWSISSKVYGRATKWRRIYDANRDQLKSPDQLHAGMVLKIPHGTSASGRSSDDEGTTFKK